MSFLLEVKPRRRNRLPSHNTGRPRIRTFSKDATNTSVGGGQIQIQRQHHPLPKQQQRIQQQNLHKQEAMRSVGISMEQVMEDLRVLEVQQHESQHKLSQIKNLKQNRLERYSAVEKKLVSLKYSNGEHRVQLNRAHEVLSLATREMEALKLDATRNDDRLKAINKKIKRAQARSRVHDTYRHKIDGRIIIIRSRESVCDRHLTAQREDAKCAQATLKDAEDKEKFLHQNMSQSSDLSKKIAEDTSKLRSDVSSIAADLHSARQMQSSTKLRAESVAVEIQANNLRHSEDMMVMMTKLKEIRSQKSIFADQRKSMLEELEIQYAKIHELWLSVVAIQKDEGHDPSPEPTKEGSFPFLDVDSILKSVQAQDQRLTTMTNARNNVHENLDIKGAEIRALNAKYESLARESIGIIDTSRQAHTLELERTERNEKFIADLETERNDVMNLRTALDDLANSLHSESKDLEEKLKIEVEVITRKNLDLDRLRRIVALNNDALVETKAIFESEKCQSDSKLNATIKETNEAKVAFEHAQREAEAVHDKGDLALERKTDEVTRAQSIMVEGTKGKIARLLKDNPDLLQLKYHYHVNQTAQVRMDNALEDLKLECKNRKLEIRAKQKKLIKQRRQVHEEEKRRSLLDIEAQCKAEEARSRKLKEKRRLARDEKRRIRVDPEAAQTTENSQRAHEANIVEHNGKGTVMITGDRRSKDKANVKVLDAKSEPVSRKKRVVEELRIVNSEGKRVEEVALRKRFNDEDDSANKQCKDAEHEIAESILSLGTPNSRLVTAFANSFEDADHSENDADDCFAGCLTQRIGLKVPTPKSVVKDKLARNRSHLSNLRGEKQCGHVSFESEKVMKGTETISENSSNHKCVSLAADDDRETKRSRKIFGSTSCGSKSRERSTTEKRLPLSMMHSTGAPKLKACEKLPSLAATSLQPSHLSGKINRGNTAEKFQSNATDRENKSMASIGNAKLKRSNDIELGPHEHALEQPTPSHRLTMKSTRGCRDERTKAEKRSVDVHTTGPAKKKLKSSALSILACPKKAPDPRICDSKCDGGAVSSTRKNPMSFSHLQKHSSHAGQASGISSGERSVSKSRRRKGNIGAFATGVGGKPVSERVEDFSFNF